MKTIRRGDIGQDVRRLQEVLRKLGVKEIVVDGIFGQRTEQAVVKFQKQNRLTADGIVGPHTWAALGVNSSGVQQSVVIEQTDHTKLTLKRSVRTITELIIHCTATPEGKDFTVGDIRLWHTLPPPKGRGWTDIGYHYVIYRDGTIHEGRNINMVGSHVTGHNANSIGIVYVGGMDAQNKEPKDTRTMKQKVALLNLLEALRMMYPKAKIYGHRDFTKAKKCPSFDAREEYKEI